MVNITRACKEWMARPKDQIFKSLEELKSVLEIRQSRSNEYLQKLNTTRIVNNYEFPEIMLSDNIKCRFSNWSFSQLCNITHSPARFLRTLPIDNIQNDLNHKLSQAKTHNNFLLSSIDTGNDILQLRAITSENYGRIWDSKIVNFAQRLQDKNPSWTLPPAKLGNTGLYSSDRDIFVFMIDETKKICVGNEELNRGFFIWNSEVGAKTFGFMTFLYREICANHIVYNATNISEFKIKHTKNAPSKALYHCQPSLEKYMNSSAKNEEQIIEKTVNLKVANNQKEAIQWLIDHDFDKTVAKEAIDTAIYSEGDVTYLWNIVQGLTEHARSLYHTDKRVQLEVKAGNLLRFAA